MENMVIIPDDEKTEEQKLNEEISALKTKIKNTEYDLAHMFRGNDMIKQKLDNTKNLLKEKELSLTKIVGGEEKLEELREFEDKFTETNVEPITQDQKDIIDEEIENELI